MKKLEKVIYDLERCTCYVPDACRDCSKYASETGMKCMENLMMDALELLKGQEPKPVKVTKNAYNYEFYHCPNCDREFELTYYKRPAYCDKCGQAVKWK